MDRSKRFRLLNLPFPLWFFCFIAGPFLFILITSFSRRTPLGGVEHVFSFDAYLELFNRLYGEIFLRTLLFAAITAAISILFAYPVAFYISRLAQRYRLWVLSLILIPLWTNFLVRILATMDVLRAKPLGIEWIYTAHGIVFALVYSYLPFAILPIYSSVSKIEQSLIDAAKDLGASNFQIFKKVIWPLSKPGVATAGILVFIPCFGEYLTPELVGGARYFLIGTFLQNQFVSARNWPMGSAAIVLLLSMTLGLMLLSKTADSEEAKR